MINVIFSNHLSICKIETNDNWHICHSTVSTDGFHLCKVHLCERCNIPAYYLIFANVPEHTFFYTPAQPILQVTYEQRISWHTDYQICFAIKHHNDDDLLLDKDGWIGKVSLKLFPVKERLMRLRWFPSSFLFLSLSFQILKPALFFHLDEVFWRVSERRSSAEFMILKRQTTELK